MFAFFSPFLDWLYQSWLHTLAMVLIGGLILYHLILTLAGWFVFRYQSRCTSLNHFRHLLKDKESAALKIKKSLNPLLERKNRKQLISQLPLLLQILSSTLKAGYSLAQSFQFAEREIPIPLKGYLQQLNQDLDLHTEIPRALSHFAKKIDHPEIHFFTKATTIQIQTGGNLIMLFQKLSQIIEEKLKLERDLQSFTSQGKMSGFLIAGLWPCSLLIFWWLSPQHIEVLFTTNLGTFLLILSLVLEAIGFWCIWKIINIKL